MKLKNTRVYLIAVAFALLSGLSFLFIKIALQSSDPFDLLAHRFTAALISLLILYAFNLIHFNHSKKALLKIIPISLFYPLFYFTFQTFGLQYTTSSEGNIILASSPILTMLFASVFLKEKTTLLQKLSILISVTGVIYITLSASTGLNFSSIKGIILMFLSALSFTGYTLMARKITKEFSNIEVISVMILISFIAFNSVAVCKHLINGTMRDFFLPLTDYRFIIAIIYLGIICTLITSHMSNYILSKIEASKMCVFTNLRIVIGIFAGAIFLKENIYYYHIIGSILIIGGVLGANFRKEISEDYPK